MTIKSTRCGFDPGVETKRGVEFRHSTSKHAMPPELGGKWGTECLNTMFPLPTLLCAGYKVKLISFFDFIKI